MPLVARACFQCSRCEHVWYPRGGTDRLIHNSEGVIELAPKPKVCPRCKSPYWDREKVKPSPTNGFKRKISPSEGADKPRRMRGTGCSETKCGHSKDHDWNGGCQVEGCCSICTPIDEATK